MIYLVFLALPLVLGAACLAHGFTPALAFFLSLAWLLCGLGLQLRRFAPVVAAATILLISYVGAVLPSVGGGLSWPSVAYGIGLFVMLELGHDCTSVVHGKLSFRAYRVRGLYIARIAVLDASAVVFLVTLAYSVVYWFPDLQFAAFVLPALFVVLGGGAYLTYRAVRRTGGSRSENRR